MNEPMITLTEMDYYRISSILEQIEFDFERETTFEELEDEINRARIVDFPEVPIDLVTMNTRFSYLVVNENRKCEMTIVYPHQANIEKRWISVTAPLGAALLGLREGDEIEWGFPDGKTKTLRILEIHYQPESHGDLHL